MLLRDMALAALTSVIWGFAFVTYKFALESFSAAQLTAMRLLIKRPGATPVFALMAWCSLVVPLPMLLFSYAFDPQPSLVQAILHASWPSLLTAFYLGVPSTLIAYGLSSYLLQRYPAPVVAPFALLSPATGILASTLIHGEVFGPLRFGGMALILAGLAVIVWPARVTPAPPSA